MTNPVQVHPVLLPYVSDSSRQSIVHGVPVDILSIPSVRESIKSKMKIRYRGPRRLAGRTDWLARSYCLRDHATHFSLYMK
jgi:hypothetical protein